MQGCCAAIDFVARAKNGLSSNTPKRIVQGDARGDKARERLDWEGVPGQIAAGLRNPGGLLHHVACRLWFYGVGISFQAVSGQSL